MLPAHRMTQFNGKDGLLPAYAMTELSGDDLAKVWVSYYRYMDALDADASALDGNDFESMLQGFRCLLGHIKYQEWVIETQSRKVRLKIRPEYQSV